MEVGDSLLGATGPGKHVDLVASIEGLQNDLAVCRGKWHGELFLVKGWTQPFSGLWTLYDYVRTRNVQFQLYVEARFFQGFGRGQSPKIWVQDFSLLWEREESSSSPPWTWCWAYN